MKRIFTIMILGLLLPFAVMAQEEEKKDDQNLPFDDYRSEKLQNMSPKRKLKTANMLYEKGSYVNALMYYKEVYEENENNACVISRLAKCNYLVRDYKEAEKWYKLFYELDTEKFSKAHYMQAYMQKLNGKCDEAKTNFQAFIDEYNDADSDKAEFDEKVKKQIEGCDLQLKTLADPERVIVDLLDEKVNNPFSDFSPFPVSADEIVYGSLRADSAIVIAEDSGEVTGYVKAQIFTSKKVDGEWTEAKLFPAEGINEGNDHVGNATFSPDGTKMYFNRCKVGEKLKLECLLYVSEKSNGKWGEPQELKGELNTEGTTNTHPSVGKDADGKDVLYFTSDREEGGKGGMDIWYAEIKGANSFGAVKNAGDINTAGDEVTPFYDNAEDVLYYSSDRPDGIGGFDVYKTMVDEEGKWTAGENLLAPTNSSVDDIYYAISDDNKNGFLVSNRPGGYGLKSETCCDDVYSFKIVREIILVGIVATEKDPETPIEGADISFFTKNGEELTLVSNFTTNAEEEFMVPLDPETVYQVNVTKSGYWGSEEVIDVATLEVDDTLKKTFFIQEIARRKIKLKRVYYNFDRYNITRKYKVSLDSLYAVLVENPDWTVEIYGHTDSIGGDPYNMVLAKQRAQSAADYLVAKGIDIDRISLIAKGEKEPLVPNSKPNGADDPKGRANNRRVDFKIITNDDLLEIDIEYGDNGPSNY